MSTPYLITPKASGDFQLGKVPTAVNSLVFLVIEVDEVDEQLGALCTAETWRMPCLIVLGPVRCNVQVTKINGLWTVTANLRKKEEAGGKRNEGRKKGEELRGGGRREGERETKESVRERKRKERECEWKIERDRSKWARKWMGKEKELTMKGKGKTIGLDRGELFPTNIKSIDIKPKGSKKHHISLFLLNISSRCLLFSQIAWH